MNMNEFISALDKAGLHNADVDMFSYCVYEPDFKQLLKDSGIIKAYNLTPKQVDVYVDSLENAYDKSYISSEGVIVMWDDYILFNGLGVDYDPIIQKIMYDLEIYLTDLTEPLYESYSKSLRLQYNM